MSFHVIQVSDTHLSGERPYFAANFAHVGDYAAASGCDLVINTGDIALDGVERGDDLRFARARHDAMGVAYRAIPGNHDLGDNPVEGHAPRQPITSGQREAYRAIFGDDWWTFDREGWRLIGINAQLLGSGLPAEDEQWSFLAQAVADSGARRIALFTHKPLFRDHAGEDADTWYRYVARKPRQRLLAMLEGGDTRLIASGHVHQHRQARHGGILHVWAPSSAFILDDKIQPRLGDKAVGVVEYVFADDAVSAHFTAAPGMVDHDLADYSAAYHHPAPANGA